MDFSYYRSTENYLIPVNDVSTSRIETYYEYNILSCGVQRIRKQLQYKRGNGYRYLHRACVYLHVVIFTTMLRLIRKKKKKTLKLETLVSTQVLTWHLHLPVQKRYFTKLIGNYHNVITAKVTGARVYSMHILPIV